MKSLFKTVFIIIFFSCITRVVGFLFRIYVSRTIGAEALGQYQVSFSIFMVLLTIVSSGLPFIMSKLTAKYRTEKDVTSERKMVTAGVVIGLVSSVILCGLVFIFLPVLRFIFADDKCITILLLLLPALVFSSVYASIRGNIWGQNRYFSLCLTELFEQVIRVVIFIILISGLLGSMDGAIVSAVSLSIACLLSSVLVVVIHLSTGGKFKFGKNKEMYKTLIKKSAPITGVRIAGSLIQPLVALIVPLRLVASGYTASQAMALYGVSMGMVLPFLFIPSTIIGSLSTALVPDLSSAIAKNDLIYIKNRIISSIKFTIFISILFIPLYIGAGQVIGLFFYNEPQSGIMLSSSAWVLLPLGLTNITSSLLNSLGYEVKSMRNYIFGAIVLFVSIWFLPKLLGINALILGFGLCFIITSLLNLKMIKKIINVELGLKKYTLISIALIIPSASICSFLCGILSNFLPMFFNLAISCSVATVFYILLCAIFNLIEINSVIVKIKYEIKKKFKKPRKKAKTKKI